MKLFSGLKDKKDITCKRCGYTWTPRLKKPVKCPRCSSYDYNKKPRE